MNAADKAAWDYNKKRNSGDDVIIVITEKTFVLLDKFRESIIGNDWCHALKKVLLSHLICNAKAKKIMGVKKKPKNDIDAENLYIYMHYNDDVLDVVLNMMQEEKTADTSPLERRERAYESIRRYLIVDDKKALLSAYLQLKYEYEKNNSIQNTNNRYN